MAPSAAWRCAGGWRGLQAVLGAFVALPALALDVRVTNAAGQALPGAVVFLQSPEARAAVRPTPGVEVAQAGSRFVPEVTVVTVGSAVSFPNRDTVRHHVYSFSPAKKFEIKLYVGTPAAPVVFDQAGIAVLGCNIHDQMTAWVVVVDTPWHGMADADGRVSLSHAPAGTYRLRVWHASLPVGARPGPAPGPIEPPARAGAAGRGRAVTPCGQAPAGKAEPLPWLHASGALSPRTWRLSTRIVALSLLLLLVVQALGLAAIRQAIERNVRTSLTDELQVGERVWARLLEQRANKLTQGAALLAADYGFRSAVLSNDQATIASALGNHGARIQATQVALLGTDFAVRAQSQPMQEGPDSAGDGGRTALPDLSRLAPQLAQRGALVAVVAGAPYQFVMVPMRAPVLVGWVLMGFELDRGLVDDLHAVSGLHATLVLGGAGAAASVSHSSLGPHAARGPLAGLQPGQTELLLDGAPHLVHRVAVAGPESPLPLDAVLTGSLEKAVAPYRALQWLLGGLTLLGLALFGLGSVWVARRVTQPLHHLVLASEQLGRGDYDTPVAHTRRLDEIGELAKAFEHMRQNIGAQQREIRQLAYWDRLTGLPNRIQFRDLVQAATQQGHPLAVVMLDLDRFKHVNDVLGYAFGDRLLQGVAQRLREAVRPGDLVARLGGDEFALLLPRADAALAQQVAQRVGAAFEVELTLDDQRVDLSAGLGIACAPEHATQADELLSHAEVAMYAAKRHRAGAQVYSPALDSASLQTLSLLSDLRQAVENNELRLFLQPKVALPGRQLCGAEGLVRWQHPLRGLVPPMQFIPFAEQTGYVRQLTLWVFEEAARQQPALRAAGIQRVSINLSTRDLLDSELPEKLDTLLRRHGARAEHFCLEITESAIMDDAQRAEATLNRLSQRGYKLSIDDFGTGYSSLAYLQRLPVDELKIDQSFVKGLLGGDGTAPVGGAGGVPTTAGTRRGKSDEKIVRSTIELAHNLGLRVVAEGVESAAVLQRLADLGCDEAQGYHMGKPMPLADLQMWALRWQAAAVTGAPGPGARASPTQPDRPATRPPRRVRARATG
jgi:diguanylate cyclase (GGDEF)-like protein